MKIFCSYIKFSIIVSYLALISIIAGGCKKYLDTKPSRALQIPSTLVDLQALLDNGTYMNGLFGVSFDETSADNYYYPEEIYNSLPQDNKDAYIWTNLDYISYPNDWSNIYDVVNVANTVLEKVEEIQITANEQEIWNNIKGSALFYRAYSFLQAAFIFAPGFDSTTAETDQGIALRLVSDIAAPSERASLKKPMTGLSPTCNRQ